MPALPPGVITAVSWHRNGRDLALSIESADSPGEVFALDTDHNIVTRWTGHSAVGGVRRPFVEAEAISWRSFDNMIITGFPAPAQSARVSRQASGHHLHSRRPESLARPGFRSNFWINERGYAPIYPTCGLRPGSGRRFMEADNQKKREDSVKDIGALLDWIHAQPGLDPTRVAVVGASYGGFMALASSVAYAPRLVAAIGSAGISHFVTLLEGTETYRRDLARAEYGDEREPTCGAILTLSRH